MEVIDVHQHIGDLNNVWETEMHGLPTSLDEEFRSRVQAMKDIGIDCAVLQPSHGYLKPDGIRDTMRVNDGIAAYRKRDPTRFPYAMGTVEPTHGERSLEEIDRVKHVLGLNGLSWHHRFQGCFIANKWMRPILRRMADLKLVPIIHTFSDSQAESPEQLLRLAKEFPELTFLSHDAFYSSRRAQEVLRMAETTPNVLWDIGGPMGWDLTESWVRRHGSERIVYSDSIGYNPAAASRRSLLLQAIKTCDLKEQDKANILGGNIRRLFGQR